MINIAGFGETDNGMDQNVGLVRSGGADGEFTVSSVHRIAGLKGNDAGPMEFGKVGPKFGGRDYLSVHLAGRV